MNRKAMLEISRDWLAVIGFCVLLVSLMVVFFAGWFVGEFGNLVGLFPMEFQSCSGKFGKYCEPVFYHGPATQLGYFIWGTVAVAGLAFAAFFMSWAHRALAAIGLRTVVACQKSAQLFKEQ